MNPQNTILFLCPWKSLFLRLPQLSFQFSWVRHELNSTSDALWLIRGSKDFFKWVKPGGLIARVNDLFICLSTVLQLNFPFLVLSLNNFQGFRRPKLHHHKKTHMTTENPLSGTMFFYLHAPCMVYTFTCSSMGHFLAIHGVCSWTMPCQLSYKRGLVWLNSSRDWPPSLGMLRK